MAATSARPSAAETPNHDASLAPLLHRLGLTDPQAKQFHLFESQPALATPLEVLLPQSAGAPVELEERSSGIKVRSRLLGANDGARGEAAFNAVGLLAFVGGYHGGAVVHVSHDARQGAFEDFVVLPSAPPTPELRYALQLVAGVAGLRLVSNTLEFLDSAGTPHLRIAAPYVVDPSGKTISAALSVELCRVDASPAAPWGRAVTAPGASTCELRVTWPASVKYPILVDPAWQSTASMAVARSLHTTTLLKNSKRVLVAGGQEPGAGATAELYDLTTNTWSATASMSVARSAHSATELDDGTVLIAGGYGPAAVLSTAERYDPASGTWSPEGSMKTGRAEHVAVRMGKDVLLLGGNGATDILSSYEQFIAPAMGAGQWGAQGAMFRRRLYHSATALPDGRIVVVGGYGGTGQNPDGVLSEVEVIGALGGLIAPLSQARFGHAATMLPNGKLLVVGGSSSLGNPMVLTSSEAFDPATSAWGLLKGQLAVARYQETLAVLANGCLLAAGGFHSDAVTPSVELLNLTTEQWTTSADLPGPRVANGLVAVPDGRVLLTGGIDDNTTPHAETLTFAPSKLGEACTSDCECDSKFCVEGFCCSAACTGACQACGKDGVCAPVPPGLDPKSDCSDEGATSCGKNGACDGKGGCALYASGTPCGKTGCDGAGVVTSACNGAGQCIVATKDCAPFLCDAKTSACVAKCNSLDDCSRPNVCNPDGACVAPPDTNPPVVDTGCGCETAAPPNGWLSSVIAALGCAAFVARRRTRATRD